MLLTVNQEGGTFQNLRQPYAVGFTRQQECHLLGRALDQAETNAQWRLT